MLELLTEREYSPIFLDAVPYSYLDVRREYAGKYTIPFVWRFYETGYHPKCMKVVLAKKCEIAHKASTEENLERWVYHSGYQFGSQFLCIENARWYLQRRVCIPPWCQCCMRFFW